MIVSLITSTSLRNSGEKVCSIDRGRGRLMSKIWAIRPGRGERTTTRSARKIASDTLWVTKTIVFAGFHPELLDQEIHLVPGKRIECTKWLVHQDDGRIVGKTANDTGPLLHSSGKFTGELGFESRLVQLPRSARRSEVGTAFDRFS